MKRYSLFSLIVGFLFFASCTSEEWENTGKEIVEGIPTNVKFSFSADIPATISTKAAIGTEFEYQITNLYVLVFDYTTKKVVKNHLFTTSDGLTVTNSKKTESDATTSGNVSLSVPSGKRIVYGIANVPDETSLMSFSKQLDDVTSLDDLKNVLAGFASGQGTIARQSGKLLMSGSLQTEGQQLVDGYCEIIPGQDITLSAIKLDRMDAKVTFNVSSKAGITFTPQEYRVVNLPKVSSLIEGDTDGTDKSSSTDFFQTNFANFETTQNGVSSFTFYTLENRNQAEGLTQYTDRELQYKHDDSANPGYETNGAYKHGQDYATYVQFTGLYFETYYDNNGQLKERSADVIYTIHLGYIGQDANDFNVRRNREYTYNVIINGVDKIILEVEEKGHEEEPGAEGNVVETDKFYLFDSHYETELITFTQNDINTRAGFRLKTPFDEGYYVPVEGQNGGQSWDNAKDFEWVKFARNTTSNNRYVKNKYRFYTDTKGKTSEAEGKLMNIKELINDLTNNDPFLDGEAVYTMYIDEFYYEKDPRTGQEAYQTFWKEFVNIPNREMHILCNTDFSKDQESSLTTSSIMISQRSIKTFYNTNTSLTALTTAWGIETLNETGKLYPPKDNPWPSDSESDGRYNFYAGLNTYNSKTWTNFLTNTYTDYSDDTAITRYYLKDANNSNTDDNKKKRHIISACLQRNQDLNRDGNISWDELKWYPAAINQYTDIWMGKDGLPTEAHLYQNGLKEYMRYLSSSGREFFGEEGSSLASYKFQYQDAFYDDVAKPNTHAYRCVRDLGISYTTAAPQKGQNRPMDYVFHNASNKKFTLTYMNTNSLRGEEDFATTEFVVHNELSPTNRPYLSFEYADITDKSLTTWKEKNDLVTAGNSPCKTLNVNGQTGWRLPNERELSLMVSRVTTGWKVTVAKDTYNSYVWSRTSSSLQKKINTNGGYATTTGRNITIPEGGGGGVVRCVRDVK
ncbi:hypothetical protein M2480_003133 [Parabacteroides sp. PFB2-12]|uniref:fimbrial protein n=1 Tax=unclassified Parabacteroides TaxID=2649774 RepID=UPI0024732B64|nr:MULTISPECIES: DUF4906 domain-containing protein [unclassified Parabacteroides]MDH6344218.1 hypothetical protein [Parabacteroides sp. PM6-13]MDH6392125.1 hypothetical protein [Parabacteroides sp. PFB2-12]